jgi:hypothetical protein
LWWMGESWWTASFRVAACGGECEVVAASNAHLMVFAARGCDERIGQMHRDSISSRFGGPMITTSGPLRLSRSLALCRE